MPNKILISQLKKVEASSSFLKKKYEIQNVWKWLWAKEIIHIRSKRTAGVSDDNSLPWLEHPRDFSDPDCTYPPTNWQPRNTGATISFLNRIFLHDFMIGKKYSLEFQTDTVTVQCPVFVFTCPIPIPSDHYLSLMPLLWESRQLHRQTKSPYGRKFSGNNFCKPPALPNPPIKV